MFLVKRSEISLMEADDSINMRNGLSGVHNEDMCPHRTASGIFL